MAGPENQDPYAPPPRYKMRSGSFVRYALVAALLGAAAWGYMEYAQQPQTALVEPAAEEQTVADNSYDNGYEVTTPAPPESGAPASTTPTETPQSTTPAEVPEMSEDPPA